MNAPVLSTSAKIRSKIERSGYDRIWTPADFKGSETAVAATLSRLVKKDVLLRVRKGVYYRPKHTRFGETRPDAVHVTEALLHSRGVVSRVSGFSAYNALGLTDQISNSVTFDVEKNVTLPRLSSSGRIRIRTVGSLTGISDKERVALDALSEINSIPNTTPVNVLSRILELFKEGVLSIKNAVKAAFKESPRVRALVGFLAETLGFDKGEVERLRHTIKTTSTFKVGIRDHFEGARKWRIA
jgi:hypothetical protein